MSAGDLQQSIIDAMQLISNKAVDGSSSPIVVKGEIVEELDESTHQYSVSYAGTIYKDVFSIADVKYSVSTVVYVLVPDGDFSNNKWILGSIDPKKDSYVTEDESDIYTVISENLFGKVQFSDEETAEKKNYIDEIRLKSWSSKSYSSIPVKEGVDPSIRITNSGDFSEMFNDYLNTYRTFRISFLIKTNIDVYHRNNGKYELKLTLPVKNNETGEVETRIYYMNSSNVEGDPYNFSIYQRQYFYFTMDDGFSYDTSRHKSVFKLEASVSDFLYTEDEKNAKKDTDYDIFIKDLSFETMEVLSEDDLNGYHLTIVSSNGNYFLNNNDSSKVLRPLLKAKGKTVTLDDDWECYWFVQDYSVTNTHRNYLQIAGPSWRCINTEKKINKTGFNYITNIRELTVSSQDVSVELRYMCILIKPAKDETKEKTIKIPQATIMLKNLSASTELFLKTATGSNTFSENIGKVRLLAQIRTTDKSEDDNYSVFWQRFDKDGDYLDDKIKNNDGTSTDQKFYEVVRPISKIIEEVNNKVVYVYETEISFNCSLINQFNTISCTFYKNNTNDNRSVNLGSRTILISVSEDKGYTLIITNADIVYKYDSDGDSPMIASYNGEESERINDITPFSYQLFKEDGFELSDEEYRFVKYKWWLPKSSLMDYQKIEKDANHIESKGGEDYYIVTGIGLSSITYNIANSYNKTQANNNNIILDVEYHGNKISTVGHPKFMKDGEGGTNGSKYAAIISCKANSKDKWYDYAQKDVNGVDRKLHMVWNEKAESGKSERGWYIHDQDRNILTGNAKDNQGEWLDYQVLTSQTGKDRESFNRLPIFQIHVYKNGREIDTLNNAVNIQWKIYDIEDSTVKKNCFQVTSGNNTSYEIPKNQIRLKINDQGGDWPESSENKVPCVILECIIKITTESGSLGISNQEIINAFYPIEVTFLNNYSGEKYPMIPMLNGGFFEILYNIDGHNPEYDNEKRLEEFVEGEKDPFTYNFECVNDLSNVSMNVLGSIQLYKYHWSVSKRQGKYGNLKISYVKNGARKSDFEWVDGDQYANIIPATTYISGETCNYIQVAYELNEGAREKITNEINNVLTPKIEAAKNAKEAWIGSYEKKVDGTTKKDYNYKEEEGAYKENIFDQSIKYKYVGDNRGKYRVTSNGNYQRIQNLYSGPLSETKISELKGKLIQGQGINFLNNYINNAFLNLNELTNIIDNLNKYCSDNEVDKDGFDWGYYYGELNRRINNAYECLYRLGDDSGDTKYNLGKLVILGTYNGKELKSFTMVIKNKNKLTDSQYYYITASIADWDATILEYNNNIIELRKTVRDKTTGKDVYVYLNEYDNLKEVKNYLTNKVFKDSNYTGLYTTDFLDDNNQVLISAYNIRSFKRQIEGLNKIIYNKESISKTDRAFQLYNIDDFLNNFFYPLGNIIFGGFYVSEKYQNDFYSNIQDIFHIYLESHEQTKQSYQSLLNDIADNSESIHIKPIIVHSNTAGLGYLNDWDGSRLYIDDDGQYIMAPTLGAGQKEVDDKDGGKLKFTGVVMGIRSPSSTSDDGKTKYASDPTNKSNQLIGLHGFSKNQPSFFINARDGSAVFGKSGGGQIVIDPSNNQGMIYNSRYWDNIRADLKPESYENKYKTGKGMLLNFDSDNPYIHLANADGYIFSGWEKNENGQYDGHSSIGATQQGFYLSHNGLSISGKDKEGNTSRIELNTGSGSPFIYSGGHNAIGATQEGFYLGKNGLSIGNNFIINIDSTATIGNNGSTIGGWTVEVEKDDKGNPILDKKGRQKVLGFKSKKDGGIYLDSNNSIIALGADSGKIHSGKHTTHDKTVNGFCLDYQGLSIGSNFKIDTSGTPFIHLKDEEGYIYSGKHDNLDSVKKGFFINGEGMSIGDTIRITADEGGKVEVGYLRTHHWTIDGEENYIPSYLPTEIGPVYQRAYIKDQKFVWYYGKTLEDKMICKVTADSVSVHTPIINKGEFQNCTKVDSSFSYIGYGTSEIGVTPEKEEDLLGGNYTRLYFEEDVTRNNQVYLGTDGFRLGRSFAIDTDGNSIFKGNIEAKHGSVGGWQISSKGFYYSLSKEDEETEETIPFNVKQVGDDFIDIDFRYLIYQKIFVLTTDGEIGVSYLYRGNFIDSQIDVDKVTVSYEDNGRRIEKILKINDLIPTPLVDKWFGQNYWHGFGGNDGSFDVYARGSHFGGVSLMGTKNNEYTYYDTNFKEHDSVKKVFGEGFRSAIGKLISENTQNFVTQDMLKDYVVKGTYYGTGSGTVTEGTCNVTVSVNLGDE